MKAIKILKGWHYPLNELPWLPILFRFKKRKTRQYQKTFKFTSSCLYKILEQSCVNKLTGVSFGWHHDNSWRIGWVCEGDVFSLYEYVYINKVLHKKRILSDISPDTPIRICYYLELNDRDNVDLTYSIQTDSNIYCNTIEFPKKGICIGDVIYITYRLGVYFGGESRAPHDMKVVKYK